MKSTKQVIFIPQIFSEKNIKKKSHFSPINNICYDQNIFIWYFGVDFFKKKEELKA